MSRDTDDYQDSILHMAEGLAILVHDNSSTRI